MLCKFCTICKLLVLRMHLSDRKHYRFPHDNLRHVQECISQFELSMTLFTNLIPQELEKIMARSSNLWRFIYAFQYVTAILLTWSEKVAKEGPINYKSFDWRLCLRCILFKTARELILIHDDTQMQMNAFHLRLSPSKQSLLPCLFSHNH